MRRVLCIDGGGIKGALPAAFLSVIEEQLGAPIASRFDLIVGTSTGGIIALGLGLGLSADEIVQFYRKLGPAVFSGQRFARIFSSMVAPRYRAAPLRDALVSVFGERRLGESRARLVVPSFNLETGKVHVYKTAHHPRFERDFRETVVDVALATAAAPTYFPTHRNASGIPLVDGGVWANNPVAVGIVEAVGVLGWRPDELLVLSLGCSEPPFDAGSVRRGPKGWAQWARILVDVFMAGQSSGALGLAHVLVGHERVVRIAPSVPPGRFGLDNVREIESLCGLGASCAREALPTLRSAGFLDAAAENFTPLHRL